MSNLLDDLNEKQLEAVLTTEGPVMAIAGAGSGKTSVLTKRIAYLIYEKDVHYANILALTFTNKAANEMKERVKSLIGLNPYDMWISTFHSMCAKILREHIEKLGYNRNFQILDDDDTHQIVKTLLKKNNIDTKLFKPKQVRNILMKMKFNEDYIEEVEAPYKAILNIVFKQYLEYMVESNLVDFEDLLLLTIRLLKQEKQIRKFYNDKFKYVLVDEFQDTNNVQYELIKLLVNKDKNLFIVGDEDQSIYAFRGANIENINKFKKDFANYHLVLLEQNYRSTNNILEAANAIIMNNSTRIPKNLYSTKGKGDLITHYKGVTARNETEFVAQKIMSLTRKGYEYNDIAILYRANSTSRQYEDIFLQKQIPYRIFGNTSFFKRKEIKDFTAYLRFILNNDDSFSFMRVVTAPRRGIGPSTMEKIYIYAADKGLSFSDALRLSRDFLGKSVSTKIQALMVMMDDFRKQLDEIPFTQFVDYVLETSGYYTILENDDKGDVRYENLQEFKTILAENNEIYGDIPKVEMLTYILEDISLKADETKEDIENAVTLMTLHAAKGLEFKVVFLVTLEMGMFPLARSFGSKFEFEEERRLMYVGVTRAKEKLFLTNADVRQTFGEISRNLDSKFLQEIPEKLIDKQGYSKIIERSTNVHAHKSKPTSREKLIQRRKANLETDNKNDISKGDKITHKVFGDGVVVSVAGDNCIIAFKHPHGVKKLLKDHPAISKK